MDWITPDWPDAPLNIGVLSTTRRGGVSKAPFDDGAGGGGMNLGAWVDDCQSDVASNRAVLQTVLPSAPAWLRQVHGAIVLDAADVDNAPEADASFSNRTGIVCAIATADCLPVLLCDRAGRVVGAAHAGWRGLAAGVLEKTVASMRGAGAGDIVAWLGPAIGPANFEVGDDVLAAFIGRYPDALSAFMPIADRPGKFLADIYCLARLALTSAGIEKISGGGLCTVEDSQRFYSYRRDRITGRMASLIWIK